MNGDFLRDLSEGIFGRQEELRQEQKAKDAEQRLQTIQLLSSLAPQVEKDSLPLLMGHLADTIGIKGRMRKFWDVFGGSPDKTIEEQLGEKVREISSGMIGPETARQSRETYKQELLQPYREAGTRPRVVRDLPYMSPPSLAGKMIFRDPRAEESEEFKQRSGAQLESSLRLQEEKGRLDLLQQQARDRIEDKRREVQMRVGFNKELGDATRFYRGQGVRDPKQARRLALNDYSDLATTLGIPVPPLTPDDNKMLDKVQAQINRLNQLALRGASGGAGGRGDRAEVRTWLELSDGSVVEADKVNFDRLPVGVTVKRMFTTSNGQPITFGAGGGAFTLEEAKRQIEAMKGAGRSVAQINAAIDAMTADHPNLKSELEKLRTGDATLTPLQQVEQGSSFSESLLGKAVSGIGEQYDKSTTVGWLRTRLQAAEASLSREKDPAKRGEFQALVDDLRERLSYAESQMGLSPSTAPTPEETRRGAELDVMKSEVDWLRSQLDYAEKQMAIAPGVVQRETLRKQIVDLKRRLTYAEGELKKKEAEGHAAPTPAPAVKPTPPPKPAPPSVPFGYIQR
jgi:hypothetical protein